MNKQQEILRVRFQTRGSAGWLSLHLRPLWVWHCFFILRYLYSFGFFFQFYVRHELETSSTWPLPHSTSPEDLLLCSHMSSFGHCPEILLFYCGECPEPLTQTLKQIIFIHVESNLTDLSVTWANVMYIFCFFKSLDQRWTLSSVRVDK